MQWALSFTKHNWNPPNSSQIPQLMPRFVGSLDGVVIFNPDVSHLLRGRGGRAWWAGSQSTGDSVGSIVESSEWWRLVAVADLEIQKGEFKVVGVAHTAAERQRWLSRKQLLVGGSGGMLPPGKYFYSEVIMEDSEAYFSATELDSPHFHEQTSTALK